MCEKRTNQECCKNNKKVYDLEAWRNDPKPKDITGCMLALITEIERLREKVSKLEQDRN